MRATGLLALGGLIGSAQGTPPDLQSGLVGYWRLDETSGTTAADSAGAGNGTHTPAAGGPTITTTGLPPAVTFSNPACLTFDGADDYVTAGASAALGPAALSVSFWTRNLVAPAQFDGLLAKTDGGNWTQGWGFFYESAAEIRFFVNQWDTGVASATIAPTQWNHVVGTWDGNAVQVYVNGTAGTAGAYAGASTAGANPFEIGRVGDDAYNINGLIDEVRVYNRVLTSAEIALLLSGQPPPTGLNATGIVNGVTLSWIAASGATRYRIERALSSTGPWASVGTAAGTTFTDTTVSPSTVYWYRVMVEVPLESAPAGPVSATPLAPPPRISDHEEGLLDGRCSCGTVASTRSIILPVLLFLAILGSVRRR